MKMMFGCVFYRSSCSTGGPTRTFFRKDVKKCQNKNVPGGTPRGLVPPASKKKVSLDENNGLDVIFFPSSCPTGGRTHIFVGGAVQKRRTQNS